MNIVKEYVYLLMINYCCEFIHQVLLLMPIDPITKLPNYSCTFLGLRSNFALDLIKSISFFFILTYFSNMSSSRRRASTPFLHKIEDFCVIQRNRHYFMKFLHTISPDLVEELNNSLVNLTNGKTVRGSTCFSPALEKQFQYFTRTKSFKTLEEMNEQTEIIMARGYEF